MFTNPHQKHPQCTAKLLTIVYEQHKSASKAEVRLATLDDSYTKNVGFDPRKQCQCTKSRVLFDSTQNEVAQ